MNHVALALNQTPFGFEHLNKGQSACVGRGCGNTQTDNGKALPQTGAASQPASSTDLLASSLAGLSSAISRMNAQLSSLAGMDDLPMSVGASDFSAHLFSKQRGELTITTQEGDVVTLKFSNTVKVDYAAQQASDGSSSTSLEALSVRSRTRVGLSVQGDLNEDELRAIKDLAGKVGALTDEFYNGNVDKALSSSANLSFDMTQLSDVSLKLSLRQGWYAQARAIAPVVTAPPVTVPISVSEPVPLPAVDTAPPKEEAATATPLATAQSTLQPTPEPIPEPTAAPLVEATTAPNSDAPAPEAAPVTAPATTVPPTGTAVIAQFVAKVREALQVTHTDSTLGFSYEFKVRLLIHAIAVNAPAAAPDAQSLNSLADKVGVSAS